MEVLWTHSPMTLSEVISALQKEDASWHPKTAQTMIGRLVAKKAIGYLKQGRNHYYRPLWSREDCVDEASESFLERMFGGSLLPMVVHFIQKKKLSPEKIQELKNILEKEGE